MQFHFTEGLNKQSGTVLIFFDDDDDQTDSIEQTLTHMGIENYVFKAGVVWLALPDEAHFNTFKKNFLCTYDRIAD